MIELNVSLLGLKRLSKSVEIEFESNFSVQRYDIEGFSGCPSDVAALVRRAWLVTGNQSAYLWKQMSSLGYRTNGSAAEQFAQERATVLSDVIQANLDERGYSLEQLALALSISVADLQKLFQVRGSGDEPHGPMLRLVR